MDLSQVTADLEDLGGQPPGPEFRATELAGCDRNLLIFALVASLAPLVLRPHGDEALSFLVTLSAALALGGLLMSSTVARRIDRLSVEQADQFLRRWSWFAVFAAGLAFYAATIFPPSPYNEQVRQAVAFIHGHTYIDAPSSFLEHAQVGPYSYALHPPLAPILLMPVVKIWGMAANQTEFSVVLGALGIVLAWMLLGQFNLSLDARMWLTIFFAAGNVFWYEAVLGTTWALPMVVAVVFELALLIELFGAARPLWLGVWGGLACLARYDVVLAMPVIALLAWRKGRTIGELLWLIPGFLAVGAIFVGLNEARYHSFFDVGLYYIPNTEIIGPNAERAFALKYLPGNLYTVFFMSPHIDGVFPYLHPIFAGQAITLTSPAFVLALRPSFKRLAAAGMGLAAVLVSIPSLVCYANGFAQFGTRHYIPAFPFLLAMMAMGMPRKTDQLAKILIVTSVALVGFGVWHVHVWGLAGP